MAPFTTADVRCPGADPGICERGPVPLFPALPSPFHPFSLLLPLVLEGCPLKPSRGLGCAEATPTGSGAEPRPKTNLVLYKAVRKPLLAIIVNILSTMFYVFEEINWRWCRHNTVQLSHIISTVIDGVSPSLKGEVRAGSAPL